MGGDVSADATATTPGVECGRAYSRLLANLSSVRSLARRGNIPAARMLMDDAMRSLDELQAALDAEVVSGGR